MKDASEAGPTAPESGPDTPPAPAAELAGQEPGTTRPVRALDPAKLIRIASVTREVLEEARRIRPEPSAVDHLRRVHDQITTELREALPPDLFEELDDLTPDLRSGSLEELSMAHAEILGWLQGLFQGTQLALQLQAFRSAPPPPDEGAAPRAGRRESDSQYL